MTLVTPNRSLIRTGRAAAPSLPVFQSSSLPSFLPFFDSAKKIAYRGTADSITREQQKLYAMRRPIAKHARAAVTGTCHMQYDYCRLSITGDWKLLLFNRQFNLRLYYLVIVSLAGAANAEAPQVADGVKLYQKGDYVRAAKVFDASIHAGTADANSVYYAAYLPLCCHRFDLARHSLLRPLSRPSSSSGGGSRERPNRSWVSCP